MKALWLKSLAVFGLVLGLFLVGLFDSSETNPSKTRTSQRPYPKINQGASQAKLSHTEGTTEELRGNEIIRGISSRLPRTQELTRENVKSLLEDPSRIQEQISFQQGSERFTSLPGVYAVSNQELKDSEAYQVIGSFLGLPVVRTDNPELTEKSYSLVVEKERGALALVTGNLKVAHSDSITAKQIEEAFGLKLLESFPPIGLSIFSAQSQNVKSLLQLAESIRTSSGVERVTLDLIDRVRKPQ